MDQSQGWRVIKEIFEEAGLDGGYGELGAHVLRKTFCRLIYSALRHDLVKTAYAMRHALVSATIQYLSFKEEEVDAAILAIVVASPENCLEHVMLSTGATNL